MTWGIHVTYDPSEGFAEASFSDVILETTSDVALWERFICNRLRTLPFPLDLLIGLDGLRVHPRVAQVFGATRARVLTQFARSSFRYGGDRATRTTILTSAALQGTDSNLYENRTEALAALRAARSDVGS